MKVDNKQIRSWIKEACSMNNVTWLADSITFKINGRLKSTLGRAKVMDNHFELNKQHLTHSSIDDIRVTVIHEACHIISYRKYHTAAHDKFWSHCMLLCGLKPDVTKESCKELDAVLRPKKVVCGCSVHNVTTRKYNAISKQPMRYICGSCKTPVFAVNENNELVIGA